MFHHWRAQVQEDNTMSDFITLAAFIAAGFGIIAAGLVAWLLHSEQARFDDMIGLEQRLKKADTEISKRPRLMGEK